MDYKEIFEKVARDNIKRDGIENLLSNIARTDFYTAPASTRYHDSEPEGLVKHSLKVFSKLMEMLEDSDYSHETLAIISLFHDLCKVGFYKQEMRNTKDTNGKWIQVPYYTVDDQFPIGHSEKSIILILQDMKLTDDEIMAINAHMGGWDSRQQVISNTFNKSRLALYLHIADLKATYEE